MGQTGGKADAGDVLICRESVRGDGAYSLRQADFSPVFLPRNQDAADYMGKTGLSQSVFPGPDQSPKRPGTQRAATPKSLFSQTMDLADRKFFQLFASKKPALIYGVNLGLGVKGFQPDAASTNLRPYLFHLTAIRFSQPFRAAGPIQAMVSGK